MDCDTFDPPIQLGPANVQPATTGIIQVTTDRGFDTSAMESGFQTTPLKLNPARARYNN
jgi:hypothetical protein